MTLHGNYTTVFYWAVFNAILNISIAYDFANIFISSTKSATDALTKCFFKASGIAWKVLSSMLSVTVYQALLLVITWSTNNFDETIYMLFPLNFGAGLSWQSN